MLSDALGSENFVKTISKLHFKNGSQDFLDTTWPISGGGQNFERANVERPMYRNLKIASVKGYEKLQLFDFFIYEIIFSFFENYFNTQILIFF